MLHRFRIKQIVRVIRLPFNCRVCHCLFQKQSLKMKIHMLDQIDGRNRRFCGFAKGLLTFPTAWKTATTEVLVLPSIIDKNPTEVNIPERLDFWLTMKSESLVWLQTTPRIGKSLYWHRDTILFGYDNQHSLEYKVKEVIKSKGPMRAMFWALVVNVARVNIPQTSRK